MTMRLRSRAGGETIKRRNQTKRRNASKAGRHRSSSAAEREARVAQLTQELHKAQEHQTATTDVLRIISS